jgi:hypothetical protein
MSEKLRVTPTGKVGLFTTSPSARFHVASGSPSQDLMRGDCTAWRFCQGMINAGATRIGWGVQDSGSHEFIGKNSSSPLVLRTHNAEQTRLDASGSFGFGIGTPTAKLHVRGNLSSQAAVPLAG